MTASLAVGFSFYVWSFLLRSFHKWYKVMSSTCYIFSPLFLFHWFSQVVKNFTFTSETPVILILLKFLSSKPAKKRLVKKVEHKLEVAFFDGIGADVQLRHFLLLSVPISPQLSRLTFLHFFSFLECPLKLACTFLLITVRCFWTINYLSSKLEIILLQETSYKAPFKQF